MFEKNKVKWYIDGLHFECAQCGGCCSGPDEGFIWLEKVEIGFIADFLKITPGELEKRYLVRVGPRVSIIEDRPSNDCIFLEKINGQKRCRIYPVRPNQCRTWPFWKSNLTSANAWNEVARRCPGINRGKRHNAGQIEDKCDQTKWW